MPFVLSCCCSCDDEWKHVAVDSNHLRQCRLNFFRALGNWIPTTPAVISIQRLLTRRRWIRINLEHPIIYCYGRI